jgi:hypothetical protein
LEAALVDKAKMHHHIMKAEREYRALLELKQSLDKANGDLQIERDKRKDAIEQPRKMRAEVTKLNNMLAGLRNELFKREHANTISE